MENNSDYLYQQSMFKVHKYFKRFYLLLSQKFMFGHKNNLHGGIIACLLILANDDAIQIFDDARKALTNEERLNADFMRFKEGVIYTSDFDERMLNYQILNLASNIQDYCQAYCDDSRSNVNLKDMEDELTSVCDEFLNLHKFEIDSDKIPLADYLELKMVAAIKHSLVDSPKIGIGIIF